MLPRPPCQREATSSRATVPTMNEKVAAWAVPMWRPSRELIGACMPTRQPAVTPRKTARPRLMAAQAPPRSLGLQPVGAHAHVDRHRRVVLPDGAHLALDQLARRLG